MTVLNRNYRIERDAKTGLARITMTGRCTDDEVTAVEANCTRRYTMVVIPNARGAILKSLDGTIPKLVEVTPATIPRRKYTCVKVDGFCNPFAFQQSAGAYTGKCILEFTIVYQEVGAAA